MEIREIKRDELPQLSRLYEQLVDETVDINVLCHAYDEIENDPHCLLIGVYEGDHLVATASLTRCFDLTGDTRCYYSMENFVVDRNYRRKGVGTRLMAYLEEYVKAHNGRYINFTSSVAREEAHSFYSSVGYASDCVKGFKKTFPAREKEGRV